MEHLQLIGRLQAAVGTLREVHELCDGLPEHREDAVQMALHLALAANYLADLGLHLAEGEDAYDAVLNTARGTRPV